ncbi:putative Ig domain-containing protein, partial [Peptostreptococcus sp.]
MNQRDLFRKKIEEKKEKASKKPRYGMRKLSVGFVSCLVGFVMFLTGVPVMAEGGQSRSVNNEVHYTLAGETKGVLDYARTDYTKEDGDGIHLSVTKWATSSTSWGYTERGPYNGRYLLNFFDDDFYTQIESIKVNNVQFEKEAGGALWKVPINNATMQSGLIGVVTNNDIVIKLKNGATLTSLGLADKKINFTTTWVREDAKADTGGYDNGFILKNNDNIPTLPSNEGTGNEYYLGSGLNVLEPDGTKSKDGNFTGGNTGKIVSYNAREKAIRSTVSFKPDQNFLQANSGWVLYINEVIPKELLKYIDTDNVRLGFSTSRGEIKASSPIKLTVDPNGDGHISTKDTPSLSIVNGNWDKVEKVRETLDSQVFYGALGQRRSYTIEYKLKSSVSNQEFAKALNEYITTNNDQLNFESWLTADFVDSTNVLKGIRKPDSGKPNKILQNSYSNAFMEVLDTDKDGLYDFLEDEIESDKFNVDTDGDGVPDGQEVLTDKTNPKDAKSYLVVKPDVTTKSIEANSAQTIVGKVPKTIYDNPADTSKKLTATNTDAGKVIVKAYKYVADDTDYTSQPVKAQTTIPFSDLTEGNFTINIPSGTFAEGDRVILVAYSPDGNNPKVSSTTVRVGAIKVTFDTNGGKWSDGTNTDKVVNAVSGNATQPEEPTRDGYQFLGWASTDNATAAEAGILNNVSEDKEVFAVWKDNKAPVIANIGDQTIVEGNAITEIPVTTDDPTATVTVKDLPSGLTYSNGKISGTPSVTSWGNDEKKEFTVTVEAKDPSGNTSTKTFKIIVQRDTDRDGTPDITDTDDDGDGVPDTVEIAKGSDPKNAGSVPSAFISPIESMSIVNQEQTVVDKKSIMKVYINPNNIDSNVKIDRTKVPPGLTVDDSVSGTVKIEGSPNITNWGTNEEFRKFEIPATVTNSDGSKVTKKVIITVQRDTDNDGIPDVTDTDDDGDGYTDAEETARGSNPKDATSKPVTTIDTISDQTVVEGNAISEISVTTNNPGATITVKDLPAGVTYDPTSKKISGTPSVTSWGSDETKDFTVTIEAKDSANNVVTKTFKITVQRDTDNDGIPDITDTDDDGDGYTDLEESARGSNPKDATSKPVTTIDTISDQTVVEGNAISEISVATNNPGATITVKDLPAGVTYDPTSKKISGTPSVTSWGSDETKDFTVTVEAKDSANNVVTRTFKITVQRDTDNDGTPDVTDTDDDGDGVPDTEETAKGSDPKNPNSRPMGTVTPVSPTTISNPTQTVIDENAITNIVITPGNTASTVTVDTSKLPNGVTYDPTTKTISGTPDVTNWGTDETKKFDIPVVITNPDGSKVTKTVEITVQRDTDGDGTPDVTDTDDDGDGVPDTEETAKGSDPKNPNSRPMGTVTPVSPTTISNPTQTVIDENAITNIVITPGNTASTVTVDTSKLPNGVTYDPTTKTISGTPDVTNWGTDETKKFDIPVVITNPDGSKVTKTVEITVQRDTDGDGIPDITDTDDDGDGYTDLEESAKGTDPKDPTSKPSTGISPIADQTVVEGNAISEITVTTDNPTATITVKDLPAGVTYDPTSKKISGTPSVTGWGSDETKDFTVTIEAKDSANNVVTRTFKISVQRDTDSDGTPDVTDTDDDGDGVPDTEEIAKGSDPKNPNSRPMGTVTPVSPTNVTNPNQTVIDENAITNIVITPGNTASTVTVDTSKLPNGVTYDPTTKTISGTPDVTNWGTDETKKFDIPVVITNPDGS